MPGRKRVYHVADALGPLLTIESEWVVPALRAARLRARSWGRAITVDDGSVVWTVSPNGVTVRQRKPPAAP